MTVTLFVTILTVGAMLSGLLTEAIKKAYSNEKKDYSANAIALINAVVVGGGGTAVTYMLLGVSWEVNNIICMQPFACLPNHITGKGVIKALKELYEGANIVAIDYDPGASEVNQLNRIKLMLSVAFQAIEKNRQKVASE